MPDSDNTKNVGINPQEQEFLMYTNQWVTKIEILNERTVNNEK